MLLSFLFSLMEDPVTYYSFKYQISPNLENDIFSSINQNMIENSSSLETRAQEQVLNPKLEFLWAAGPVNCGTAHLRFSGIEPPQADTEHIDPCSKKRQNKEIIAPNGVLITTPNEGTDLATISFMNLKSMPATNQEQTQERDTGPRPGPMTSTPEQDNQAAKLRFLTNGRTPKLGSICCLWTQVPSSPGPGLPNALMDSPWKILSLEGGTI
ncbi:hypothetical protein DSO57_1033065 [Entomophthora muscae]|uniref:Uncharacterized protein n=1 Tax=Entomophthora muscae TaxID=34485 RepID=A0ACC2TBH7_9FUNG|nr:hypothetical protein DSO57_1033065 [Entomophthora muscae]